MDWLLISVILTAFALLGSSRITSCIRLVALQGCLLSIFPLVMHSESLGELHAILLSAIALIIKAIAIPLLLYRTLHQVKIRQEVEPIVSLHLSLIAGVGILIVAFSSLKTLPISIDYLPRLTVPTVLTNILIGFFLLISRTKAITQAIGFLVLENGVFLFGISLVQEFPLTVEVGVLLDLFVGILVMGIMIFHINRTFDHIDTKALVTLRDSE